MAASSPRRTYELPNQSAFVDGPVVYHFEEPGARWTRPDSRYLAHNPLDSCKSMPLDACYLATEGGGAEGTPGYLRLEAYNAFEFYAEAAPIWWIPGRLYDLRDTWTTFYLKAIEPITVDPGWVPRLFIASHVPSYRERKRLSGWMLKEPLKVGDGEWAYNEIFVANDASKWINYTNLEGQDDLDEALGQCGFIGWMYGKDKLFRGVQATGVIGWDEFRFNLKDADLQKMKNGELLDNALVF